MNPYQIQNPDLARIEKLIAHLGGNLSGSQSSGPYDLLIEHLEAARQSLLGGMPREYQGSLRNAMDSAAAIEKSEVRKEAVETLRGLQKPERH